MMKYAFVVLTTLWVHAAAQAEEAWQTTAAWRTAFAEAAANGTQGNRRTEAGLHIAMFSAGNHVDPRYQPVLNGLRDAAGHPEVAAAMAAYTFIQEVTGDAAAAQSLFDKATEGVSDRDLRRLDRLASRAVKRTLEMINERDDTATYWVPEPVPGRYDPVEVPVTMEHPPFVPFSIPSRDAFRPEGPTPIDSDAYAQDLAEVQRLGGQDSDDRTEAQEREAFFWWLPDFYAVLEDLVSRRDIDLLDQARIFMLFEMIVSDADLVMADSKNHFLFWRPVVAIRRADLDGRPETEPQPDWLPFMRTPPHPEYVCGHCIWGASAARAMEHLLPLNEAESFVMSKGEATEAQAAMLKFRGVRIKDIEGMEVVITDYQVMRQRISDARIYAGAHFRTSNDHGDAAGTAVADYVIANTAQPLK
ncbi:MAG: vanadium-dependent haloperoxidase [Pseudomonadota bacterium]